ncbi:hypothetical protein QWZ04_12445 [Vibrio tapetis subsp. quintayensis]|uniref:hypothetical protein n=1 Tax=Vibrio tapetis TaxID=52443 RepID=UPI0025B45CDE|nr:hypothetical protein [Vibrio tapetis]MDN3681131.1 hypothetical protein [Vibrio tapetis subsp. quintayensis]
MNNSVLKGDVLRGRLMLIALVVVFALPALAAKLILTMNWYQPGVTNQGELVQPSLSTMDFSLPQPEEPQWRLAYVLPKKCTEFCQKQLYLLQQSHISLGKYKTRVMPTVFVSIDSDTSQLGDYVFAQVSVDDKLTNHFPEQEFVIIDPLGQFVMHYPKLEKQGLLISQSKGMLADFRKLLKLSRVG